MSQVELDLVSARGERLAGLLHVPDEGEARGLVLLSPCFTCTRDVAPVRSLARDLAQAGFLAYRFDPAGSGKSEGRFADATVGRYVQDLVAVAGQLRGRAPRLHLAGHSLGGVVSLLAAREANAASVITMGSNATRTAFERILGRGLMDKAVREGSVAFDSGDGVIRPLTRAFVEDLATHDALAAARELAGKVLVIHGDADSIVPLEAARTLADQARARLVVVPGGAHLLARQEDRAKIREAVLEVVT